MEGQSSLQSWSGSLESVLLWKMKIWREKYLNLRVSHGQWMHTSKLMKLPSDKDKPTDLYLRKQFWTYKKNGDTGSVLLFCSPLSYRCKGNAGIHVFRGPSWFQLDHCDEHNESHDEDQSKNLKYNRIVNWVCHGCAAPVSDSTSESKQ